MSADKGSLNANAEYSWNREHLKARLLPSPKTQFSAG